MRESFHVIYVSQQWKQEPTTNSTPIYPQYLRYLPLDFKTFYDENLNVIMTNLWAILFLLVAIGYGHGKGGGVVRGRERFVGQDES